MTITVIDARRQVAETMSEVRFSDMTTDELLAMLSILQRVLDRVHDAMIGPVVDLDSMRRRHRRRLTT
jgi:hypothetical protein